MKSTIGGLSSTDSLDLIAHLVDQSCDNADISLAKHALQLADKLEPRLQSSELALLDYFRANAWACQYQYLRSDRAAIWDFEQPEICKQVLFLRRAANSPGFALLNALQRCQILTSLGSQLNTLGRCVEAQALWGAALAIDPNFWMARANRGHGLMFYAGALYDPGHQEVMAFHAHRDFVKAVALIARYPHLGDYRLAISFSRHAEQITQHYDIEAISNAYKPDGWDMGLESTERAYRRWCLDNVLFLNPLNDVETAWIAANDIIGLPTFTTEDKGLPLVVGMFNELKQGFASARWMLWDGIRPGEPHFSDHEVLLYNTFDSPSYGLPVEKVKIAFRLAYSLLDKIAYFLNHYLGLGIPERGVSFRNIWREKGKPVREHFAKSENWPLRGLFWLSQDLFEEGMKNSTEPEARNLADLRNHLEHRHIKVHGTPSSSKAYSNPVHDTLIYAITRSDLEQRTLRLIQLVRSALIYLSLGMHRRKRERAKTNGVVSMPLEPLRDDWKR